MTRSTAQAQTFLNPNDIDRLNRIAATLGFVTTSVGFPYLTHETLETVTKARPEQFTGTDVRNLINAIDQMWQTTSATILTYYREHMDAFNV